MKDTEVLIVEARQYQHGNGRLVVPWVFGFTEEARVAKRESNAETERSSIAKGEANFWSRVEDAPLSDELKKSLRHLVDELSKVPGCELPWQRSALICLPDLVPQRVLLGIRGDGSTELYLARWQPVAGTPLTEKQVKAREQFYGELRTIFNVSNEDLKKQYPQLSGPRGIPKARELEGTIRRLPQ